MIGGIPAYARREIRRLLLDVIVLDGEQDAAPSLADMARRAKSLLDGPLSEGQRKAARRRSRSPRASGATRADRKAAKREETRRIRAEVFVLADGLCERCGWPTPSDLGHLHHTRGGSGRRLAEQSVDNCGWLCGGCHRQLHANATYAREFREEISTKRAARRTP